MDYCLLAKSNVRLVSRLGLAPNRRVDLRKQQVGAGLCSPRNCRSKESRSTSVRVTLPRDNASKDVHRG